MWCHFVGLIVSRKSSFVTVRGTKLLPGYYSLSLEINCVFSASLAAGLVCKLVLNSRVLRKLVHFGFTLSELVTEHSPIVRSGRPWSISFVSRRRIVFRLSLMVYFLVVWLRFGENFSSLHFQLMRGRQISYTRFWVAHWHARAIFIHCLDLKIVALVFHGNFRFCIE